jgi:hypothetical protein
VLVEVDSVLVFDVEGTGEGLLVVAESATSLAAFLDFVWEGPIFSVSSLAIESVSLCFLAEA